MPTHTNYLWFETKRHREIIDMRSPLNTPMQASFTNVQRGTS
jgi:hypothetical protein